MILFLPFKTPEEVKRECHRVMEILNGNGGYSKGTKQSAALDLQTASVRLRRYGCLYRKEGAVLLLCFNGIIIRDVPWEQVP